MQTDRKKKIIQEFIKKKGVISSDRKAAYRKGSDGFVRFFLTISGIRAFILLWDLEIDRREIL